MDEQIYQLSTLVAGEFSLQEVLDKLAEAAVKIIGAKACSIRLLNEETNDLKMRSTYGLSEAYRNKGVVTKDDPVITAAFAGEAVLIDDMRADDRIRFKEATNREGLVSQLTVAMQFRNRPIGVLRLYSPKPRDFTAADISVARAVASQCAVAITNAKLYRGGHRGPALRRADAPGRLDPAADDPGKAAADRGTRYRRNLHSLLRRGRRLLRLSAPRPEPPGDHDCRRDRQGRARGDHDELVPGGGPGVYRDLPLRVARCRRCPERTRQRVEGCAAHEKRDRELQQAGLHGVPGG